MAGSVQYLNSAERYDQTLQELGKISQAIQMNKKGKKVAQFEQYLDRFNEILLRFHYREKWGPPVSPDLRKYHWKLRSELDNLGWRVEDAKNSLRSLRTATLTQDAKSADSKKWTLWKVLKYIAGTGLAIIALPHILKNASNFPQYIKLAFTTSTNSADKLFKTAGEVANLTTKTGNMVGTHVSSFRDTCTAWIGQDGYIPLLNGTCLPPEKDRETEIGLNLIVKIIILQAAYDVGAPLFSRVPFLNKFTPWLRAAIPLGVLLDDVIGDNFTAKISDSAIGTAYDPWVFCSAVSTGAFAGASQMLTGKVYWPLVIAGMASTGAATLHYHYTLNNGTSTRDNETLLRDIKTYVNDYPVEVLSELYLLYQAFFGNIKFLSLSQPAVVLPRDAAMQNWMVGVGQEAVILQNIANSIGVINGVNPLPDYSAEAAKILVQHGPAKLKECAQAYENYQQSYQAYRSSNNRGLRMIADTIIGLPFICNALLNEATNNRTMNLVQQHPVVSAIGAVGWTARMMFTTLQAIEMWRLFGAGVNRELIGIIGYGSLTATQALLTLQILNQVNIGDAVEDEINKLLEYFTSSSANSTDSIKYNATETEANATKPTQVIQKKSCLSKTWNNALSKQKGVKPANGPCKVALNPSNKNTCFDAKIL